ncbi:hypothetical protein C8J57DRAFT_1050466 [Mycena rebaudengoi]|nr:hypothetical protein C8J57DRAFT_1050466 [Mycena rebaudengoi]
MPHNFARDPPVPPRRQIPKIPTAFAAAPLHPNRLVRKYRKATHKPTPLTHEQIEYLIAKASAPKTQQKNELGASEPWTAVPNPVPDTGLRPADAHGVKLSTANSAARFRGDSTILLPVSTFSPLPPLLSRTSTPTVTTLATTALLASSTAAENQTNTPSPSPPHRLSTGAIALVAVAGGCLLLGLFVIIKVFCRPPRRTLPVPSRPILDDSFPNDGMFETKIEESPVFGGTERLSERPSGLWNWTQYPAPATTTMAPSSANDSVKDHAELSRSGTQGKVSFSGRSEKPRYYFTDAAHSLGAPITQTPANSPYPAPIQGAFTRAASRLSMGSMSMYPASPAQNYGATSFTADGYPIMERGNPKVLKRSRSSTVGDRDTRERPPSRVARYSYGVAYDGAEVKSPQMVLQSPVIPIAPAMPGRTRIKSSYYAHPRTSAMPPLSTKDNDGPLPPPSLHRSQSRADRDNKGLVSALGFGSPATVYPSSPQPTLYPDDSLSVVETKRPAKRIHKKPAPSNRASRVFGGDQRGVPLSSPTLDATAALGSLMLMDFGANGVGESVVNLDFSSPSTTSLAPKKTSRSDDKPPRVPSPPPLPSLTQMGLERANPEAYAAYRSPTYSICGFYDRDETDRKSRTYA